MVGECKMDLKSLREQKHLTQKEAAKLVGLPFRTYQNYEYGIVPLTTFRGKAIVHSLETYCPYAEDKGIWPQSDLIAVAKAVLSSYSNEDISFAYLFGSYAKGKATAKSDVDLLVDGSLSGLRFFALQSQLEKAFAKKVDLVRLQDLKNNLPFVSEIMKTGIRIYG